MKRLLLLVFFIILFSLSPNFSFACSFTEFVPLKFNTNEYVFFGKIIGYTDKVESTFESYNRKIKFVGFGLKVKVENAVNLPIVSETIEVFSSYPKDTACTKAGVSLFELKKEFPVGTQVRVIGQENDKLIGNNNNNIPRIEVSFANQGHLFNNITKKGTILSTNESIFDYRLSLPLYGSKFTTDETFVWLFEVRKDLKRLEQTTSQNERFTILKRLAFSYDYYEDYENLIEKYLSDETSVKELIKLKKNWEKKN